jgi:hypothetical protein
VRIAGDEDAREFERQSHFCLLRCKRKYCTATSDIFAAFGARSGMPDTAGRRTLAALSCQYAGSPIESKAKPRSERLETLKKARERMADDRDAFAKTLAAPFDRDKAERARIKFIETQVLIDAIDRAIDGEPAAPAAAA